MKYLLVSYTKKYINLRYNQTNAPPLCPPLPDLSHFRVHPAHVQPPADSRWAQDCANCVQASLEVAGHASSEARVRGHIRKRPHRDPPPPPAAETGLLGEAEAGVAGFEGESAGGALFFDFMTN